MKKKTDDIIKYLSLKHNIPTKDVEEAIKHQFLFVKNTIESATQDVEETFKTVKLPYFGKFLVPKDMIKHIINNKNRKNGNKSK